MNVIVICSDAFRHDHLGFVKKQPVYTPYLDQLAGESATFSDFRLASFPSLSNRIEMFSGRFAFPVFDTGPMPFEFPTLAEVVSHHGIASALWGDNFQVVKKRRRYGRGFGHVQVIPGRSRDEFQPSTTPMIELSCAPEKLEPIPERLNQYRRNAWWYQQQDTHTAAILLHSVTEWLKQGRSPFFTWIEVFDPHQPWDPSRQFLDLYPWNKKGETPIWPKCGYANRYSTADLENIRSLYKAQVTQLDTALGAFLNSLREEGLLDNTALLFCSDHGYYLGEHGFLGKPSLRVTSEPTMFYEELAHLPLVLRHPEGLAAGRTIAGLCQPPDLYATVLELLGIPPVPWTHGNSLVPRLRGHNSARRLAVAGSYPTRPGRLASVTVWTDDWCLMHSPFAGRDGSALFHRQSDPEQAHNVLAKHRDVADNLFEQLLHWLDDRGVPHSRKQQLLRNAEFPRLYKLRYNAMLLQKRCSYWRHYRNYLTRPE
jgi:arylsulfatase A-like enzyme